MKNLVALFTLIILSFNSLWSQIPTCDCKTDLDFIIEKLKKTPSYKKQIKGSKLLEFQNVYNSIVSELNGKVDVNTCFKLLQKQIDVIDDFHINLYSNTTYFSKSHLDDKMKLKEFKDSPIYKSHPKSGIDMDSLREKLLEKPLESIEGLYKFGKTSIEIGLVKTSETSLEGIVLDSDHPLWETGHVLIYVSENKFKKYNLLNYDVDTRQLKMTRNVSFDNQRLLSLKKINSQYNFEFKLDKTSNWEFKQLSNQVQYVYFGSFSNAEDNIKAFKAFYAEHKHSFTAPNIIVDLRSNGGGNSKWSDPFIKLFRKSKAKIYVITNQFTISNAEQFTLKLKNKLNATHLGQTSHGTIAYGTNYGYNYNTPSSNFTVLPTDMNFHNAYYNYEGFGITPDIPLDFDKNWIEQTLNLIENQTQN
ncbi:MAG: S41 family peptidase [Winogradskyella sp.]|jgi:hypothetical protein